MSLRANVDGVTANTLAGRLAGLPGLGRTRVLAVLAAHRGADAGRAALNGTGIDAAQVIRHGLGVDDSDDNPATVYLAWRAATSPGPEAAQRITLALAGLTVDAGEATAVIAAMHKGDEIVLTRIKP